MFSPLTVLSPHLPDVQCTSGGFAVTKCFQGIDWPQLLLWIALARYHWARERSFDIRRNGEGGILEWSIAWIAASLQVYRFLSVDWDWLLSKHVEWPQIVNQASDSSVNEKFQGSSISVSIIYFIYTFGSIKKKKRKKQLATLLKAACSANTLVANVIYLYVMYLPTAFLRKQNILLYGSM